MVKQISEKIKHKPQLSLVEVQQGYFEDLKKLKLTTGNLIGDREFNKKINDVHKEIQKEESAEADSGTSEVSEKQPTSALKSIIKREDNELVPLTEKLEVLYSYDSGLSKKEAEIVFNQSTSIAKASYPSATYIQDAVEFRDILVKYKDQVKKTNDVSERGFSKFVEGLLENNAGLSFAFRDDSGNTNLFIYSNGQRKKPDNPAHESGHNFSQAVSKTDEGSKYLDDTFESIRYSEWVTFEDQRLDEQEYTFAKDIAKLKKKLVKANKAKDDTLAATLREQIKQQQYLYKDEVLNGATGRKWVEILISGKTPEQEATEADRVLNAHARLVMSGETVNSLLTNSLKKAGFRVRSRISSAISEVDQAKLDTHLNVIKDSKDLIRSKERKTAEDNLHLAIDNEDVLASVGDALQVLTLGNEDSTDKDRKIIYAAGFIKNIGQVVRPYLPSTLPKIAINDQAIIFGGTIAIALKNAGYIKNIKVKNDKGQDINAFIVKDAKKVDELIRIAGKFAKQKPYHNVQYGESVPYTSFRSSTGIDFVSNATDAQKRQTPENTPKAFSVTNYVKDTKYLTDDEYSKEVNKAKQKYIDKKFKGKNPQGDVKLQERLDAQQRDFELGLDDMNNLEVGAPYSHEANNAFTGRTTIRTKYHNYQKHKVNKAGHDNEVAPKLDRESYDELLIQLYDLSGGRGTNGKDRLAKAKKLLPSVLKDKFLNNFEWLESTEDDFGYLRTALEVRKIEGLIKSGTKLEEIETGIIKWRDFKASGSLVIAIKTGDLKLMKHTNLTEDDNNGEGYDFYIETIQNVYDRTTQPTTPDNEVFDRVKPIVDALETDVIEGRRKDSEAKAGFETSYEKDALKAINVWVEDNKVDATVYSKVVISQGDFKDAARDIDKAIVSILVYGAGDVAMTSDVLKIMQGKGVDNSNNVAGAFIVNEVLDTIRTEYPVLFNYMKGLQDVVTYLKSINKTLQFKGVGDGFLVDYSRNRPDVKNFRWKDGVHKSGPNKGKDKFLQVEVARGDKGLDIGKLITGVAAVFTHSGDKQLLSLIVLKAKEAGIPVSVIHDAIGVPVGYTKQLDNIINDALVEFSALKPLENSLKQVLPPKKLKEVLDDIGYEDNLVDKSIAKNEFSFRGGKKETKTLNQPKFESEVGKFKSDKEVTDDANKRNKKLEDANRQKKVKALFNLLNLRTADYKSSSPYKQSKISGKARRELSALKIEFAANKEGWNDVQLAEFAVKASKIYREGKIVQLGKNKDIANNREAINEAAVKITKNLSGIDAKTLNPNSVVKLAEKNSRLLARLKRNGPLGHIANVLNPASMSRFDGLVMRLLPKKGDKREGIAKQLNDILIRPVDTGNYLKGEYKINLLENIKSIKSKYKITNKFLAKKVNIKIDGTNLTNDAIADLYINIKDPRLHRALIKGGITFEKMNEILSYLEVNPTLKAYANEYPSAYEVFLPTINDKLDQHGGSGIDAQIIPTEEDAKTSDAIDEATIAESYDVLRRAYDGTIPQKAPYIPFSAVGDKSLLEGKEFETEGSDNFYTVMSGSLKQRTYAGSVDLSVGSNERAERYADGVLRTVAYLDFAKNAIAFFTKRNLRAMEATLGSEWRGSMDNMLKRIITGRIEGDKSTTNEVRGIDRWTRRGVTGALFINPGSFLLQSISVLNYSLDNPVRYFSYFHHKKKNQEAIELILKAGNIKLRGKGGTDVIVNQLFKQDSGDGFGRAIDNLLQKGYIGTKTVDKIAIATGGAPYLAWRLDVHRANKNLTEKQAVEQAMIDFDAKKGEAQQTTEQSGLGQTLTTKRGKYFFAFQNAVVQFSQKISASLKEIQAGKNILANIYNIKYLLIGQVYGFIALGNAMLSFWFGDDEDDEEENPAASGKTKDFLIEGVRSLVKTAGLKGQGLAYLLDIMLDYDKIYDFEEGELKYGGFDEVLNKSLDATPLLSTKGRGAKKVLAPGLYKQSDGFFEPSEFATRVSAGIDFGTGFPAIRIMALLSAFNDLGADDLNVYEKLQRLGGQTRWEIGKSLGKFGDEDEDSGSTEY